MIEPVISEVVQQGQVIAADPEVIQASFIGGAYYLYRKRKAE